MWWFKSNQKHLPLATGPFVPGCTDVILGYTKTSPFIRLFYPTNAKKEDETELRKKWIPWMPDDYYVRGMAKVIMIFHHFIRFAFWWNEEHLVPVLYGEKAKVDKKLKCVVLSHGLGGTRFLYSNICYEIASHGFLVVSLEHRDLSACHSYYYVSKEDAQRDKRTFLEFKHILFGKNHYEERFEQVQQRSKDCSQIVDFLIGLNEGVVQHNVLDDVPAEKGNSFQLDDLVGKLDLESLTIMGHSFGGSTALYAISERKEYRYCILMDPWMFPIKNENLPDKVDQPILFINTETFHIQRNVLAMAKLMTNENRKMYTIRHTTHENQCDNALILGCWLNLFMKKLDPFVAMKINNSLILEFLNQYVGYPEDTDEYKAFLNEQKEYVIPGLTKPWA